MESEANHGLSAWFWNRGNDSFGHLEQQGQGAENFVTAGVKCGKRSKPRAVCMVLEQGER